jgi:hypothetical protein
MAELLRSFGDRGERTARSGGNRRKQSGHKRNSFELESIEPRLLLSADLSYAATSAVHDLTLRAAQQGENYYLRLFDTTTLAANGAALSEMALKTAIDLNVVIQRGGSVDSTIRDAAADTLRVDLSTFAVLDGFVRTNGGIMSLDFVGGSQLVSKDHMTVAGKAGTVGYGLAVHGSGDVTVSAQGQFGADLTISGDQGVHGDAATDLKAVNLTIKSTPIQKDGIVSSGILANANAMITLMSSHLTASGALTLEAFASVSASDSGADLAGVKGSVITSSASSKVDINGATILSAKDININSIVESLLTASAASKSIKLVTIVGGGTPEIAIRGTSSVNASGNLAVSAISKAQISAVASPESKNDSKIDAAVVVTSFDNSTKLFVGGSSNFASSGSVTLRASSVLTSTTIADGNVANTAGASVAVSRVTGDTTASVDGATIVGKSVTIRADSERVISTIARSSPGGASASSDAQNRSETTLADSRASTADGAIKLAGAVAVGTNTGTTSAYVSNSTVNVGSGIFDVASVSTESAVVKADGSLTDAAAKGVGVAVAVAFTDRGHLAYLSGNVDVTASSISVRVLAPRPSNFDVAAISGAGGGSAVSAAGALATNISLFRHLAYFDKGAVITTHGSPSVILATASAIFDTTRATAAIGGANSAKQGVGASVAFGYEENFASAYVADNATLTGGQNLSLSVDLAHTMNTVAENGAKGGSTDTPVVAISVSRNEARATLGLGETLVLSGDLVVNASLRDMITTSAGGNTDAASNGVGMSVGLAIILDDAFAGTSRSLLLTGGAMAFLSSAVSASQVTAKASVAGGVQDDGGGKQSVDQEISGQTKFADGASKGSGGKGTGDAKAPSAGTADGAVSVAGAAAVNISLVGSRAVIGDGLTITSKGALSVLSSAQVDGFARADGSAVLGERGFDPGKAVDTTANTVDIGNPGSLKTGDKVTYVHGAEATNIGGLLEGHDYYVNVQTNGTLRLYDTADHAKAGGTKAEDGLVALKSAGTGAGHALKGAGAGGSAVGVAIALNVAKTTNLATLGASTLTVGGLTLSAGVAERSLGFDPAVSVASNAIGVDSRNLRDGDAVTSVTCERN